MNSYFARKYVVQGIFISVAFLIALRLFYLQVIDDSSFLAANNNVLRKIDIYPARGVILDRKGKILVQNEPVYDVLVTPRDVKEPDTALFCQLVNIDTADFRQRLEKARKYSPYKASIFIKQLSSKTYARLQEHLYEFSGFYVQNRTVRSYPDSIAAQFLGYIGEVGDQDIARSGGFYKQGDYIGVSGVERAYEDLLRGQRGVENVMVDAFNRPKGHFMDGKYDTIAVAGEGLVSSLDKDLQVLGEKLMKNKVGTIVAIEPSTGEVLTFVSSPTYDPNSLVGRERGNNLMNLFKDPYNPMFIRPIQAQYPPGSVFKVVSALTAQQAGIAHPETTYFCAGGYHYGGGKIMRCTHSHGSTDLYNSIAWSCNTYYGYTYAHMIDSRGMRGSKAYTLWRDAVTKFGIGHKLGIDLPHENSGLLPTSNFYTKGYGNDKWGSSYNISLSIGQGEMGITPLQMANIMAIVANKGFYYRPHLIKAIGEKKITKAEFTEKIYAGVDEKYYAPVIEGLSRAVNRPGGTAYAVRIADIEMCGKTGTAQNPHGENHSVFFAYAPRVNPKIAIAVFVENGGYGATWAGPIASMLVEKYLKDSITLPQYIQDRIYKTSLLPKLNQPVVKKAGQQVNAEDLPVSIDTLFPQVEQYELPVPEGTTATQQLLAPFTPLTDHYGPE